MIKKFKANCSDPTDQVLQLRHSLGSNRLLTLQLKNDFCVPIIAGRIKSLKSAQFCDYVP